MDVYLCALYCIVCVCVSLPMHESCVKNSMFSPPQCESLRIGLTGLVLYIVLHRMQRVTTTEDVIALVIPLVLCITVIVARLHLPLVFLNGS